jgi:hypothetical protein
MRRKPMRNWGKDGSHVQGAIVARKDRRDAPVAHSLPLRAGATQTLALGRKNELCNPNTCGARHHDTRTPFR